MNETTDFNSQVKKKKDFFIPILIGIIIFNLIFNTFFFQLATVNGTSMSPTFESGQFLIVNKIASIDTYERGDIVIFKANGKKLIKRLIGLPNETVQIKDNVIYINNEPLQDYVDVEMQDYGLLEEPITLKEGEYIFLGDNRNNSSDSRFFGAVSKNDIIGKIIFRFVPLDTDF